MAPVRRYLRITQYSILEVRVYLENPTLVDTWLLRKNDPALRRIIQAIRPLVLPKLREENERAKTKIKSKSKQAIKDVVVQDDFEVSIFLKDQSSRHYILNKKKEFGEKPKLKSNSSKLTGWLSGGDADKPIDVDADRSVVRVEDDDDDVDMSALPQARPISSDTEHDGIDDAVTVGSDHDSSVADNEVMDEQDDKKKLGIKTFYDGFAIYGKILCLIVKRKGAPSAMRADNSGQATMENWVSTQVAQEMGLDQDGLMN